MLETQSATYYNNQRRHKRIPVSWPARIDLGGVGVVTGVVRDWSEGGLCFEPEVGFFEGRFLHGLDVAPEFRRDDPVEISLVNTDAGRACLIRGSVRWTGYSQAHDCAAIGVEAVAA